MPYSDATRMNVTVKSKWRRKRELLRNALKLSVHKATFYAKRPPHGTGGVTQSPKTHPIHIYEQPTLARCRS